MRKQFIIDADARADLSLAEPRHNYSKQQRVKHGEWGPKASGLVIQFPGPPVRTKKKADLLAVLEAENAALRHRAVELALQIQETHERSR
jgi:hypothetical protein